MARKWEGGGQWQERGRSRGRVRSLEIVMYREVRLRKKRVETYTANSRGDARKEEWERKDREDNERTNEYYLKKHIREGDDGRYINLAYLFFFLYIMRSIQIPLQFMIIYS